MTSITGFTANRMLIIENETIINGEVVGDDLILTTREGTDINAGNVRGPIGTPGVTEAELAAFMPYMTPAGVIADFIGTVAPPGWLGMTGQTVTDGQTLYPNLWARLPASMQSGANIVMPDTRGRMTVGLNTADTLFDTIGETGGSKNAVLVSHSHTGPSHTHTGPSHTHSGPSHSHTYSSTTSPGGQHTHQVSGNTFSAGDHDHAPTPRTHFVVQNGATTGIGGVETKTVSSPASSATNSDTTGTAGAHAHTINLNTVGAADHQHSFSGTTANSGTGATGASGTGATGSGGTGATSTVGVTATNANLPPYIVFMKIIKAD